METIFVAGIMLLVTGIIVALLAVVIAFLIFVDYISKDTPKTKKQNTFKTKK